MRKLRDVLRLRHAAGLSIRDISRTSTLGLSGPGGLASIGSDQFRLAEPTDNKRKLSQKTCHPRLKLRFSYPKRGR